MSEADREKWDQRYAAPGDRMGAAPKAIVTESAPLLPASGAALDLACGEGQAAVWLAERGLRCTGVDLSGVGLAKARARAAARGVEVEWVQADLEGWDPGQAEWDVVVCVHYLDRNLVPALRRAVRPGGLLLMEVLTDRPGTDPRFLAAPNELLRWFVDWRVLRYAELPADRPVASLVARRP